MPFLKVLFRDFKTKNLQKMVWTKYCFIRASLKLVGFVFHEVVRIASLLRSGF